MISNEPRLTRFFHPVISAHDLKRKPKSVMIGDEKIVVYRDHENEVVALEDRCPHRFTPLSEGKVKPNGRLACPYHGWNFNGKGEGLKPAQSDSEKASCKVQAYQVVEKYGYLWIGNSEADPQAIPEYGEPGWDMVGAYSLRFQAPLHISFDNFSEDEHFPFVHKFFGWDESGVGDVEFNCERVGEKIRVHYFGPQRSFFGMSLLLIRPGLFLNNDWVTSFDPPNIVYTAHLTDKDKNHASPGTNRLAIYFVPHGPNETDLHVFQFINFKNPAWTKFLPLLRPSYLWMTKTDIKQDAEFVKKLKDIPPSLHGMALGKYDKPIVYGRKLLNEIYYGKEAAAPAPGERPDLHV
ncbi:MAG: aromatic ring-hydroxylating dioxygenase subunit alpha [Bdellovibrionia bacterium]